MSIDSRKFNTETQRLTETGHREVLRINEQGTTIAADTI